MARELFQDTNVISIPLCVAATFLVLPGRPLARLPLMLVFLAAPMIYVSGILAINSLLYIPPPFDIEWMLRTSLERLMFGVVPALFCMAIAAATVPHAARDPRDRVGASV